jgi:hypothetical protein
VTTPTSRGALETRVFQVLVVAVSLAFFWILRPYAGAILWGAVLAIVFAPLNRRLRREWRERRTPAAQLPATYVHHGNQGSEGSRRCDTAHMSAARAGCIVPDAG